MPQHDVLIIGAGLAGQRAAVAAAEAQASVGIMSKVHPVRSHSNAAQGGINAALDPEDSWESHAFDTVKGSDYLGDQDAIEIMCREAPNELLALEHMGVTFHRDAVGKLGTRAFGGASKARTYYVADITGQALLHVLYEQLMRFGAERHEIARYEEWFVTGLALDEDGRCAGAIARNVRDGRMELFTAKAVILACGGAGNVFKPTTNALICTGDGIAYAYRIGAELMDMEMIQYHPTTLASNGLLITEAARGEGAILLNRDGERFMEKYAPNKMELASRDVVSRAEETEIQEGRGFPDGSVHLDIRPVGAKRIFEALREIVNVGRDFAGIDITKEPVPVRPGMHYIMGGVKTDNDGRSNVPGLYAAGEVACVSVHGGNRLGANSLLDTLVFGRISGEAAAHDVRNRDFTRPSREYLEREERQIRGILDRVGNGGGERLGALRDELGESMNRRVAVFRDEAGLKEQIGEIADLKDRYESVAIDDGGSVFNQDLISAIELGAMLDCAETMATAALHRKESRGAHHRLDFPDRNDEEWLKHIVVTQSDSGPKLSYGEVTITKWQPQERRY